MAKFGLMLKEADGYCFNTFPYYEGEEPPAEAIPEGVRFVWITDEHPQWEQAYRICVDDDTEGESPWAEYKTLSTNDGPKYDFATGTFTFSKIEKTETLLEECRRIRDEQLDASDYFMLLDDVPEDMMNQVIAWRDELRAMPEKVISGEWTHSRDIVFSPVPVFLHDHEVA
jgi:hypothetical protein